VQLHLRSYVCKLMIYAINYGVSYSPPQQHWYLNIQKTWKQFLMNGCSSTALLLIALTLLAGSLQAGHMLSKAIALYLGWSFGDILLCAHHQTIKPISLKFKPPRHWICQHFTVVLTIDPTQLILPDVKLMGDILADQLSSEVNLFGIVSGMVSHFNSTFHCW